MNARAGKPEGKKPGIVYLVGGGPGHPGLITRLGYDLLQRCDAVVFDDLISDELIQTLPDEVERHYAGKRAGRDSVAQKNTTALLIELARAGKTVVRLKGGDPLIFGRGFEEVDALSRAGIEFVIVPGVSAVQATAAGARIPLTDRRAASWLALATGHPAESGSPEPPWEGFARLEGGTLAVYMGMEALPLITSRLMDAGMTPDTPAAVVFDAYSGTQRIVRGDISDIARKASESGKSGAPALVIIGTAVGLADAIASPSQLPLTGKRVMVTRPADAADSFLSRLRELGAEPVLLPCIRIQRDVNYAEWEVFLERREELRWAVFTSAAGVRYFFAALWDAGLDNRALGAMKFAAIGSGTADALAGQGFRADLVPDRFTGAALAKALTQELTGTPGKVLRVRGNLSDGTIERTLAGSGVECLPLTVYQTGTNSWDERHKARLLEHPPDFITFSSLSTVTGFVDNLGVDAARALATKSALVAIGEQTKSKLEEYGLNPVKTAKRHSVEGMVEAILRHNRT